MKYSIILGSSAVFNVAAAATAYDSDELWTRAASTNIKMRDLEEYRDFVILPRTPATTRSQTHAQQEAARGGGNQNLGVIRGGVNAGHGGRGGAACRGRTRTRAANRGRGTYHSPGSYAEDFPSWRGFPSNPYIGGRGTRALQPISAAASLARGQDVDAIHQNIQAMGQNPAARRPGGRQWVSRGVRGHSLPPLPPSTALGHVKTIGGRGYFHSAHGSYSLHPGHFAASERQTPIPNTEEGTATGLTAWNTHTVKAGLTLTHNTVPNQQASSLLMAMGDHNVKTIIKLPSGGRATVRVLHGQGHRSVHSYAGPLDTMISTDNGPHPPHGMMMHATNLHGIGSVVSMAHARSHALAEQQDGIPQPQAQAQGEDNPHAQAGGAPLAPEIPLLVHAPPNLGSPSPEHSLGLG